MQATKLDKNALFKGRRSVRRFRDDPIPEDILAQVLEAATLAPSAHNSQPWRFAVLLSREVKERLAQAMGADFLRDLTGDGVEPEEAQRQVERSRQRILGAPVAVVLCLDRSIEDSYPEPRRQDASHLMMTQSVALAGGTMLLAAHAHGLGGVWMCAPLFAPGAVRLALDLPEAWEAQALILLGYAEQAPERRKRLAVEQVTRYY
jgi:F420 biosynthesis protein FbiB-like protein